jgi:transposase
MILTYDHKLYPNASQAKTLDRWLRTCGLEQGSHLRQKEVFYGWFAGCESTKRQAAL